MDKCYNRKGSDGKSKSSTDCCWRGPGGIEAPVWVNLALTLTAGVHQPYAAKRRPRKR